MNSCLACAHLRERVLKLTMRINNDRTWDEPQERLRRAAHRVVLRSIESHFNHVGHYVDSVEIIWAFGRRSGANLTTSASSSRTFSHGPQAR